MTHKYLDNNLLCTDDDHHIYDDAAFLCFDEPISRMDFQELGQWILQFQDNDISKTDFQKLQHCLVTDREALKYYVDFTWLCAALHALYSRKQAVLTPP